MTLQEEFEALYRGDDAVTSFALARLEVAHWLGQSPTALDLTAEAPEEVRWAIDATRSWFESGISIPERPPISRNLEAIKALLAPKVNGRTREPKITPNRLWVKRRSY